MNEINLSTFYRHSSFMKDVREGEKKIMESEKELAKLPKEESSIQIGDLIFSSGKGTKIENIQGKVLDKWYNGNFLAFKVDWDFATRKINHEITIERLKDIKEM
jgi:hypothetical protein